MNVGFEGDLFRERLRCTSFSLSSNVICVCSLSFVCELRVDVGFECDECIMGLVLIVSLVNVGVAFKCRALFGGVEYFVCELGY